MMLKSTIDPILAIPDDAVPGSANAAAGGGGGGNGRDPKTGKKLTEQQQQQNAAQVLYLGRVNQLRLLCVS